MITAKSTHSDSAIVALITTCLDWGGTEGHVTDLALGFLASGLKPLVIVDRPPVGRLPVLREAGIRTLILFDSPRFSRTEYQRKLTAALRVNSPSIAHVNSWERRDLIHLVLGRLGIPVVETLHTTIPYMGSVRLARHRLGITRTPWKTIREAWTLRKYQPSIIHISDISLENYRRLHPYVRHTARVYCGAFIPENPVDQTTGSKVDVLWIGSMIERKNPLLAITVWKSIARNFPKARLTMIGNGPLLDDVRDFATTIDENQIRLTGNVPDLFDYLSTSQIMFLTSAAEGIPKNLRYAFNFGMPVVSTAVGAIPEVVREGFDGFLARPDDHAKLMNDLYLLIANEQVRREMGKNARATGQDLFDIDRMVDNVLETYRSLCGVTVESKGRDPKMARPRLD